jgi:hypothetical protein
MCGRGACEGGGVGDEVFVYPLVTFFEIVGRWASSGGCVLPDVWARGSFAIFARNA